MTPNSTYLSTGLTRLAGLTVLTIASEKDRPCHTIISITLMIRIIYILDIFELLELSFLLRQVLNLL